MSSWVFLPLSHIIFSMSLISGLTVSLLGTYPYHILVALLFGCILFRQLKNGKRSNLKGLPLLPGPKGYPLIGNLFDFPIANPWLIYKEWCKTYGNNFKHLSRIVLNSWGCRWYCILQCPWQALLILSSPRRITDILEQRSLNYLDRPWLPMTVELWV